MKKIFLFLSVAILFAISATAQTATPRTGVSPYTNGDNTFAGLSQHFGVIAADAAGLDSVVLKPRVYKTIYTINSLLDSLLVTCNSTSPCYAGDEIYFLVKNTSTGVSIHFSNNWFKISGGATNWLVLTASKRAYIKFVFDGTFWIETSRVSSEN